MSVAVVIPSPLVQLTDVVGRGAAVDAILAVKMYPNQVNMSQTATLIRFLVISSADRDLS
jgi:hypothetical protein